MRFARFALLVALLLPACKQDKQDAAPEAHASSAQGAFSAVELSPTQGELKDLLASEAAKATSKGQKPFVEVHAGWCMPCKQLEASLGDPMMQDAFKGTYQIRLDSDAWGNQLMKAGIHADGIPAFFELDAQGKPTGRTIDGGAWDENIPKNMAPPLKQFFHPA